MVGAQDIGRGKWSIISGSCVFRGILYIVHVNYDNIYHSTIYRVPRNTQVPDHF